MNEASPSYTTQGQAAAAAEPAPLLRTLGELNHEQSRLADRLDALFARLDPLMCSPSPDPGVDGKPRVPASPFDAELMSRVDHARWSTERIESALRRLAI